MLQTTEHNPPTEAEQADVITSPEAAARKCPKCEALMTPEEMTITKGDGTEDRVPSFACTSCDHEEQAYVDDPNAATGETPAGAKSLACQTCGLQILASILGGEVDGPIRGFAVLAIEKTGDAGDVTMDTTFGRSANGFPLCPKDNVALLPVGPVPVDEAFRGIQDALKPAEPQQPRLPGTTPPFDIEKAYRAEHRLRIEVRQVEEEYLEKAAEAKDAKKELERVQELLGKLMDENDRREREAGLERRGTLLPEQNSVCLYEQRTGQPCPICREARRKAKEANDDDIAPAALEAVSVEEHLTHRGVFIAADDVDVDALASLAAFAHDPDQKQPPPFVRARAHIAGPAGTDSQCCERCGVILVLTNTDQALYPEGAYVRLDCAGAPGEEAADVDQPEPARQPRRRHKTPAAAAQAKSQGARAAKAEKPAKPKKAQRKAKA